MQSVAIVSFLLLAVSVYRGARAARTVDTKDCKDWSALQPVAIDAGEQKCFITRDRSAHRCIMKYKVSRGCETLSVHVVLADRGNLQQNEVDLLRVLLPERRHVLCGRRQQTGQEVSVTLQMILFSGDL